MKCLIFQSFESLRSFGLERKQAKVGEGCETRRRLGREQFSFARARDKNRHATQANIHNSSNPTRQ